MPKSKYIEAAVKAAGRLSEEQVAEAGVRLKRLPRKAAVTVAYFVPAEEWIRMDDAHRQAIGADFARRVRRDEFPGLSIYTGSNSNLYVRW